MIVCFFIISNIITLLLLLLLVTLLLLIFSTLLLDWSIEVRNNNIMREEESYILYLYKTVGSIDVPFHLEHDRSKKSMSSIQIG